MGVAMSAVEYPWWDVCSPDPAGRMEGPASGAVGSVSLRDEVNGCKWVRRSSSAC